MLVANIICFVSSGRRRALAAGVKDNTADVLLKTSFCDYFCQ